MTEYSMLSLFRSEVETQVAAFKQSLSILKQQPALRSEFETANKALHAMIGAAQLVGIDPAVALMQAMQNRLAIMEQSELSKVWLERLLQVSDRLLELSRIGDEVFDRWLADHSQEFVTLASKIQVEQTETHQTDIKTQAVSVIEEPAPSHIPDTLVQPIDQSMLELFRLEVEQQSTLLSSGLVALETQPRSTQDLEALMRAAHSIKGAARIVGLDGVVQLAHAMEDCLVAAQQQTLTLTGDDIDVFLHGVDLLQHLAQVEEADLLAWLAEHQVELDAVKTAIATVQDTQSGNQPINAAKPMVLPIAQSKKVQPTVAPSIPETNATKERAVRVSAQTLTRMMGLAGESLIEANWLPTFANALKSVRSHQLELSKHLESLTIKNEDSSQVKAALLDKIRHQDLVCREQLGVRLTELEGYIQRMTNLSDRLYREVVQAQMRPFADGVENFPRMVRDMARQLNKQVKLEILGGTTTIDRDISARLEAPLIHLLRNAIDHGIETVDERLAAGKPGEGMIRLEAAHRGGMLAITLSDDGRGIDPRQVRQRVIDRGLTTPQVAARLTQAELMEFLFLPGFSMTDQVTELSGRGVGLDIAKSMAQEVGGTVRVSAQPGQGTTFHFQLPLTLSVLRTLLVEVAGEAYAFPLARIEQIVTLSRSAVSTVEGRPYFNWNQQSIGLIPLYQVLDLPPPAPSSAQLWVVILRDQSNIYGLIIDRCLGERELVVRPLDARLGKVQDISAAALMEDGSLVLILDISDLVRSLNQMLTTQRFVLQSRSTERVQEQKRVLIVDDSITVREMERKILRNRGYQVDVAVDGIEAWNAVRSYHYDLVISDIDMPRMNGIDLIRQIKQHPRLNALPVIVVSYRDREDDRVQGLEAGADYYITKSSFQDDSLTQAVEDLIGE